ncbi:MAG: hypothetical protein KBT21_06735 [Treponema sp.]|nr:hypothetical protein [Candidatus Treponema merdequi]
MGKSKNPLKSIGIVGKIILVLLYDIYGIVARLTSGKLVPIIVGILQIVTVNFAGIIWLIDLITVICKKDVIVLA